MFYAGNWKIAKDENEKHLNGVFVCPFDAFRKIGGFDERIQSYGWDDSDLYARLENLGLERRDFLHQKLYHLQHPVSEEINSSGSYGRNVEITINRMLTLNSIPWDRGSEKSSFKFKKISRQESVAELLSKPKSLQEIYGENKVKKVALQILKNNLVRMGFARKFLHLVEDLDFANKLYQSYRHGPVFIIHVQHGLGNRLRALASAMILARKSSRHLKIVWPIDHHCGVSFGDLFETNGFDVYEEINLKEVSLRKHFDVYNYMEREMGAVKYEAYLCEKCICTSKFSH